MKQRSRADASLFQNTLLGAQRVRNNAAIVQMRDMLLFEKYQFCEENVQRRGYSQTCIVRDENGCYSFFAKWILGVEKNSTKSKILSDTLRHFKKANHPLLPEIVDYGYDFNYKTCAILYKYVEGSYSLEDYISNSFCEFDENLILLGLSDVAECLCSLHLKYNITHGDLTPANILVDRENKFHLIDFGLADITNTLSQEQGLQIFARAFAAPEKYSNTNKGFPYQADIYSFGKILEWVFSKFTRHSLSEENEMFLRERILSLHPEIRPTWKEVVDYMKLLRSSVDRKRIKTKFSKRVIWSDNYISNLNSSKPQFEISLKEGENIKMSIYTNRCFFDALWVLREKELVVLNVRPLEKEINQKSVESFEFDVLFEHDCDTDYDIPVYFQRWYQKKNRESRSLKRNREATNEELKFYEELIDKEIEVIRNHSLKLQYDNFEVKGNEIHFSIIKNEKCTSNAGVLQHIENGNDVNADPIRYIVSSDGSVGKNPVSFVATPMDYEERSADKGEKKYTFKIKDFQYFKKSEAPFSGFLMEDYDIKIEEKRRQKDAINKVRKNEVQNPDLIYYLFKPRDLSGDYIRHNDINLDIKQKGIESYSYNQKRSIVNALRRTPLSVIQGPPGTGKTTVITEIVFQLLKQKPDSKILITSQTNNAVDQVLENLMKNEIPILRLSGLTEPRVESIKKHTIKKKLSGWKEIVTEKAQKNIRRYSDRLDFQELEEIHKDWLNTIASIQEEGSINQRLVDSIRVIGATCNHIASKKYSKFNFEFDYIIMDESGKATVAESLVPIILGNNLIFVGDHRQLRPMLTANREVEKWLREKYKNESTSLEGFDEYFNRPSLFEEVISIIDKDYKTQLTECRRLSEEQVKLTSKCFYEPEGDDAIEYVARDNNKEHNLPLTVEGSVFMIDIGSDYKNEKEGQSSFNKESIGVIEQLLVKLNQYEKVGDYSIGLITAYSAQFRKLRQKIRKMDLKNIRNWSTKKDEEKFTVSVIDRFQGLERDIVIVDLVKSGANLNLGFLETPNRINVGLSRQKRLLLIVGDYYGIINARTKRCNGDKCALQNYLRKIPTECVIKSNEINTLFR